MSVKVLSLKLFKKNFTLSSCKIHSNYVITICIIIIILIFKFT